MIVNVIEIKEATLFEETLPHEPNYHFKIELTRSSTIYDAKKILAKHLCCGLDTLCIYYRGCQKQDGWHIGTNILPHENLVFTRNTSIPCKNLKVIGLEYLASLTPSKKPKLQNLLNSVKAGFALGATPELSEEGSGGTYFLKNASGARVACFKPSDEEPSAHNNPRTKSLSTYKRGVRAGEAVHREVAAYITDTNNFSGVPETLMVEITHPDFNFPSKDHVFAKVGSLQRYISGDLASDFSPHLFPVDEVHKIGILDLRLLNSDRNDSNLLVRRHPKNNYPYSTLTGPNPLSRAKSELGISPPHFLSQKKATGAIENDLNDGNENGFDDVETIRKHRSMSTSSPTDYEYKLVPIDHGYCLPDRLEITWYDLCWLDWPQSRQPFSAETLKWIEEYDIEANVEKLQSQLDIREPCLHLVRIAGHLLKMGAKAGLCLHDIASIFVRQDVDTPSVLEKQISRSKELAEIMQSNLRVRGCDRTVNKNQKTPSHQRCTTASSSELPRTFRERSDLCTGRNTEDDAKTFSSTSSHDVRFTPHPMTRSSSEVHISSKNIHQQEIGSETTPQTLTSRRASLCSSQLIENSLQTEKEHIQHCTQETQLSLDNKYFFKYLKQLLTDVIVCVIEHRKKDKSLFRVSSSLHLTSPHRIDQGFSFWTDKDKSSPTSKRSILRSGSLQNVFARELDECDVLEKFNQLVITGDAKMEHDLDSSDWHFVSRES